MTYAQGVSLGADPSIHREDNLSLQDILLNLNDKLFRVQCNVVANIDNGLYNKSQNYKVSEHHIIKLNNLIFDTCQILQKVEDQLQGEEPIPVEGVSGVNLTD
tara:strand:+ start:814 stop:1122 length:309 start_codon:yes stop_codon:yes gene_type:complete